MSIAPHRHLPILAFAATLAVPWSAPAAEQETQTAEPAPEAAASPLRDWFVKRLRDGDGAGPPNDPRTLGSGRETEQALTELWADYKAAAIELGWDKELIENQVVPPLPPMEELAKLAPEDRPQIPQFKAGVIPCGDEKMPYLLFSRGEKPAKGYPLFFQTHGGGSTDQKLPHPHGWQVNSRDWQNQVGVCLFRFPEGMYFVPRMANDNKGRWWMKHNHIAFDFLIRRAILFREVDPDRIYMMGISEGAYGTEALTPFWADRFAGGCAMAGGAGGGERFYNLRNTAFRNDTGENDTMFGRVKLAREAHDYLARLKEADPGGYDHMLFIHPGRGHGIDYQPGPAWIATKTRNTRPDKLTWFNFALDGQRRTDFSWLSLAKAPERDTIIIAKVDRKKNTVGIIARINPPDVKDEGAVYNTSTPDPVANRVPYTGNTLTLHLDDQLVDLDQPVTVIVNGKEVFADKLTRRVAHMAEDIARHGDPGRVFPARCEVEL